MANGGQLPWMIFNSKTIEKSPLDEKCCENHVKDPTNDLDEGECESKVDQMMRAEE